MKMKIVKIINEYSVVVNVGSEHKIHEGQQMEIYVPGQEIIDPETNENLGTLDFVKAKIEVKDVFPKMCICVNRETSERSSLDILMASRTVTKRLPLNIDSREISGGFENIDKKIRVGDLVRTVD